MANKYLTWEEVIRAIEAAEDYDELMTLQAETGIEIETLENLFYSKV